MATEITRHEPHDPKTWDGHRAEQIAVTIDTDANGDGTLSVDFRFDYGSEPVVLIDDGTNTGGTAAIQNKTQSGMDIAVTGGTANSTVEVLVHVQGPQ